MSNALGHCIGHSEMQSLVHTHMFLPPPPQTPHKLQKNKTPNHYLLDLMLDNILDNLLEHLLDNILDNILDNLVDNMLDNLSDNLLDHF